MKKHIPAILLAYILFVGPASGQTPDSHGEVVLDKPEWKGVKANAPIPPNLHFKNTGGSDGAGLCVDTSVTIAGAYLGLEDFWKLGQSSLMVDARKNPGGSWPEKLERELKEHYPNASWYSWESPTTEQVADFSSQGLPVCTTTNTGALYGYDYIYHYIVNIHCDDDIAMIVDSNDPGKYHAMPRAEYDRRAPNPKKMWGFVFLANVGQIEHADLWLLSSLCIVCAGLILYVQLDSSNEFQAA